MEPRLSRKFLSWLLHHALEFKGLYIGAFFCLYVLQLFQREIPERIRDLTIKMSDGGVDDISVWVFFGLAFGILFFRTFSRLLFFYPARVQQKHLRMELLSLLESVPHTRYKGKSQGQIYQILFDDINNLRAFIGFGLLQISNLVIAAWVLIPKFTKTDAYLWPAFYPLFASVFLYTIVTFINQRYYKKMMDMKGEVQQNIIEAYEAKQTIKNFHCEDSFIKGFSKISGQELSLFFKTSVGFAFTGPYVKLGLGASLIWAAMLIRQHGGNTSDLVFFSGFLYLFLEPVMFMSWVAVVISQGVAAWKRVKELYGTLMEISPDERVIQNYRGLINQDIIETKIVLWDKELSTPLKKGIWTAIIGETGSGKSFALSQIATMLILDGVKVSMVQQEPYLFNDTVAGNIFLGKVPDSIMLKKAYDLMRIFQIDNLAETLDEVLLLEVGENGKRLSGGQMKRLALIRSLLSGARILIWDDPFSSVDIILERRIINGLKASSDLKDLTFIISTHRLTTVRLVDEVIFIGKEQGIKVRGKTAQMLREEDVKKFFKEQMVDLPLA
jgi:ATP-binding cassette subfamily B multidrug efflux pump